MRWTNKVSWVIISARKHGLYTFSQKELAEICKTMPGMGGDIRAIEAFLADASDKAMYLAINETIDGNFFT